MYVTTYGFYMCTTTLVEKIAINSQFKQTARKMTLPQFTLTQNAEDLYP